MAILHVINSSNWKDFFNSDLSIVMFSKSDCEQCKLLESAVKNLTLQGEPTFCKVMLDEGGLSDMKLEHKWISNIDILPFNVLISRGVILESWSGFDIEHLIETWEYRKNLE